MIYSSMFSVLGIPVHKHNRSKCMGTFTHSYMPMFGEVFGH